MRFVFVFIMVVMLCSCSHSSDKVVTQTEAETTSITVSETITESVVSELISDEQAVGAIRKYCYTINPDLEKIVAEDYLIYWEIASSDDREIVVLYRSYTGAQVRYYIDRVTGNTNVTEFVLGITEEEEPTDEIFNVRDYMNY